jgi:two-component system phosphate regulon sensor histidine kinase PhoR
VTGRIFVKLLLGTLALLVVALAAVDVLASRVAETSYRETLEKDLSDKGRILSEALFSDGLAGASQKARQAARSAGLRLTVVSPDGRVLVESEAEASRMENHRSRPEITAALAGRTGSAVRQSGTIGSRFLYVAVPCPQGALRLAVALSEVEERVNAIRRKMLVSTALAFLPTFVVAALFARSVSAKLGGIIDFAGKLAQGDFRARLREAGSDELGLLGKKLNETGEKLEKLLETMQAEHREIEKLERARKDFVINVSHELRTPLASIQGYTETLLDGAMHEEGTNLRFLNIIRQNVERLTNLTADLLTLSRIELKTQRFQFASYYVRTLLDDCVDSMRPMASKRGLHVHVEAVPPDWEVFCDSRAVHQALGNLLDNAIKYTPEGGDIYVGARLPSDPSPRLELIEIYVRDTGIGIPDQELPRLFERFYRVDKARSRELGGTGLGLAIVKHLARAHGGDVRVHSAIGQGSTFSFTLPVQDPGLMSDDNLQAQLTNM